MTALDCIRLSYLTWKLRALCWALRRMRGPGRGKKNGSAIVAPPFTDAPTRAEMHIGKKVRRQ
jgi:hypothetical protein